MALLAAEEESELRRFEIDMDLASCLGEALEWWVLGGLCGKCGGSVERPFGSPAGDGYEEDEEPPIITGGRELSW